MKLRTVAVALVALALAVLLIWRNAVITPGIYRLGFFLGLATLIAWLLSSGEMFISLGHGSWKRAVMWPIALTVMLMPPIILMETGIAGYRGFMSFMRYVSLILAIFGLAWLAAGFIVPPVLRRRLPK